MKLGLIARHDCSGLGNQTKTFYDHLKPYRTLLIDMSRHGRTGDHFPERFPNAWRIIRDDQFTDEVVRDFVKGLDAILTAETPYNYGLYDEARQQGVRTVCHTNPEFYRYHLDKNLPKPDMVVLPTTWLAETMPYDCILPTPIDRKMFPFKLRTQAQNILHIAGHKAAGDRNGTQLLQQSIKYVTEPVDFLVRSQAPLPSFPFRPRNHVKNAIANVTDSRDLYTDQDVLVMCRRYAGQALAINEALSLGMPVVILDRNPENAWPGCVAVDSYVQRQFRTQAGMVDWYSAVPRVLSKTLDWLAQNPGEVEKLSLLANDHAESISWRKLRSDWMHVLEGRTDLVKWRP